MSKSVSVKSLVGASYEEFWDCRKRYRIVKGGRGSKKSTTTAIWIIYNMMYYFHRYGVKPNTLVLRWDYCSHSNSTFAQLRWAIDRLGVSQLWKVWTKPLCLIYSPSGQKIFFRGLKNPESITSMTVETGHLCWCWWEEASQFRNEQDFNKVDLSIRGELPAPLFKQHTITFNPWSDKLWIKKRFFDNERDDCLAITRNYDCNEYLDADDIALFERMRIEQPKRYAIEGRGDWGISEGLVFTRWSFKQFDPDAMVRMVKQNKLPPQPRYIKRFGMDFGFSHDPTAFVALLIDEDKREIYICAEVYKTGMVIDDIYNKLKALGCENEKIVCDSALPQMIEELRRKGLHGVRGAKKGPNSIKDGIARLQDYEIFIHPSCKNAEAEFSNYTWKTDRLTGRQLEQPIDEFNHLIDAMRYATEDIVRTEFRWTRV